MVITRLEKRFRNEASEIGACAKTTEFDYEGAFILCYFKLSNESNCQQRMQALCYRRVEDAFQSEANIGVKNNTTILKCISLSSNGCPACPMSRAIPICEDHNL